VAVHQAQRISRLLADLLGRQEVVAPGLLAQIDDDLQVFLLTDAAAHIGFAGLSFRKWVEAIE
jgi:hypothetical protein